MSKNLFIERNIICKHGVNLMYPCYKCNTSGIIIKPTNQGRPEENYDESVSTTQEASSP
jgi:hypothetical protein